MTGYPVVRLHYPNRQGTHFAPGFGRHDLEPELYDWSEAFLIGGVGHGKRGVDVGVRDSYIFRGSMLVTDFKYVVNPTDGMPDMQQVRDAYMPYLCEIESWIFPILVCENEIRKEEMSDYLLQILAGMAGGRPADSRGS